MVKVEPMGFTYGLDMGNGRDKLTDDFGGFSLKNEVVIYRRGKCFKKNRFF